MCMGDVILSLRVPTSSKVVKGVVHGGCDTLPASTGIKQGGGGRLARGLRYSGRIGC